MLKCRVCLLARSDEVVSNDAELPATHDAHRQIGLNSLFSSLGKTRRLLVLFAALMLMVPLLAACADGDDEDDPTEIPDAPAAETTPEFDVDVDVDETVEPETTPTDEATEELDVTPDTDATADAEETAEFPGSEATDATPDSEITPDIEPDVDTTPDTDATADVDTTPDTDATPDTATGDDPFGGLADLSAEVPNFTVNFTGNFENVPDDLGELYSAEMEMTLRQSEPDVYYMRLMTTGEEAIEAEIWSLPDATYISEDGETAVELPAGLANEFAPAEALTIVPDVAVLENAEEVGEDEVNGRTATEYVVDAEQAAMILVAQGEDVNISNPEGDMRIWIDEELGVVLQMTADITFENEDGSEGSIDVEYEVSDIGDTEDIEAPATS